jgi:hypothetical protein
MTDPTIMDFEPNERRGTEMSCLSTTVSHAIPSIKEPLVASDQNKSQQSKVVLPPHWFVGGVCLVFLAFLAGGACMYWIATSLINQRLSGIEPSSFANVAVFAEFALETKPMQPGWNKRVFNRVETQTSEDIILFEDGTIELFPGFYQIDAISITSYLNFTNASSPVQGNYPGYCIIADADSFEMLATCSISNAKNQLPSYLVTYLEVPGPQSRRIGLYHQNGNKVAMVWLSIEVTGSLNHVFSRIQIQRVNANSKVQATTKMSLSLLPSAN